MPRPGKPDDIAKTGNGWPFGPAISLVHVGDVRARNSQELEEFPYSRLIRRRSTYQNIVISELKSATAAATWLPMG